MPGFSAHGDDVLIILLTVDFIPDILHERAAGADVERLRSKTYGENRERGLRLQKSAILFILKSPQQMKYERIFQIVPVRRAQFGEKTDFAAVNTFLQGGMVYLMAKEQIPNAESVAAIFRYPVHAPIAS